MRRIGLALLLVGIGSGTGGAAPGPATAVDEAAPARRHAVYLELLGKGGAFGLGYGLELHRRFALGVVASLSLVDGQRIASLSPFVTGYVVGTARHRWFVDLGPQIVHLSTPSPVPEWSGTSETGVGAQLSTGYELRSRFLLRAFAMASVGKNGAAPWLGLDVGWTL